MSEQTIADIDTQAEKVIALIEASRRVLADGQPIDLVALEGKVRDLCETATAAPDEDQPGLQVMLAEIIDHLDDLTEDLTARHYGQAGQEETPNSTHQRALGAYGGET
jgi:hypothetical protein